jgi:predicted DNA-binding transcriptional regulator YafY
MRQKKPWEVIGMSRASWYRHGKPETKPQKVHQATLAQVLGVSIRTIQRDAAERRQAVVAKIRALLAKGRGYDEVMRMTEGEADAALGLTKPPHGG